jgi:multidrug efflux pump
VPIAFIDGVTGQFYRQFAVTIAASVLISAFNSLTLSPALAAVLLKPHGAPKDALARGIDRVAGRFFGWFNARFKRSSDRYAGRIGGTIRRSTRLLVVYAGLVGVTVLGFTQIPGGFIPTQDKQYLFAGVQLPEGATLERTEAAMKRMGEIALATPGVKDVVQFPGLNAIHFVSTPNVGVMFIGLDAPGDLPKPAAAIAGELTGKFGAIQDGMAFAFMPPPVNGYGNAAGVEAYVQDRQRVGYGELNAATQALTGTISQQPGFGPGSSFSSFQANVPQLDAVVDRDKVKESGLALTDVYDSLQVYLGSAYVNDFNLFGRTYSVYAQADAPFRDEVGDVARLQVRNAQGEMVPLGSVVELVPSFGPDPVVRYNGYPAADVSASPFDPASVSSTDAVRIARDTAGQVLPRGMALEFTGLTYQQVNQGIAQFLVFPLCVLLVYLVLAALYESWSLPLAVILIVPMCMLSAFGGIWVLNQINGLWFVAQIILGWINPMTAAPPTIIDMNVFTQIGLVVLMGLACKNAILIVEVAIDLETQGRGIVEAAIEACRLRLRPILMTSFAFIAGVLPLVFAGGAGAEVRHVMGVTVFFGMLGVTFFGLFFTPVFYVVIRRMVENRKARRAVAQLEESSHA